MIIGLSGSFSLLIGVLARATQRSFILDNKQDMTTYRSKIGLEFIIPVTVIIGGIGILLAVENIWFGSAFTLLFAAFIVHMLLTTYYQVNDTGLRIKCGFFFDKTIDPGTIREIKETNNPVSSPAASIDRLVISYNRYDTVIISPKEKDAFINHLTRINPGIKVILKGRAKQSVGAAEDPIPDRA